VKAEMLSLYIAFDFNHAVDTMFISKFDSECMGLLWISLRFAVCVEKSCDRNQREYKTVKYVN
jgi:hypothetical protein